MGRLPAPLAHLPKPENPHAFMRSTARLVAVVCHASLPYLRIMFQVSKETLAMPVLPQSPEPHAELYGAVFGGSAANSDSRPPRSATTRCCAGRYGRSPSPNAASPR